MSTLHNDDIGFDIAIILYLFLALLIAFVAFAVPNLIEASQPENDTFTEVENPK